MPLLTQSNRQEDMLMLDKTGFDLWADGYDKTTGISDEAQVYPFSSCAGILSLTKTR